jgi:hypothetical protein
MPYDLNGRNALGVFFPILFLVGVGFGFGLFPPVFFQFGLNLVGNGIWFWYWFW